MSDDRLSDTSALFRRVHGELTDSFDEELEMEVDDVPDYHRGPLPKEIYVPSVY